MASNFKYGSSGTDLLDLSAKCDSLMVGSYGTTLNANNYCPDTTNLVKYSTSILNGIWANKLASYANYYKVGSSATSIGIAAKGCAPVPKRYSNGSHITTKTLTGDCSVCYLAAGATGATSGEGIYYKNRGAQSWTFLKKATHIVVDIVGAGGGGSGGNTGWNISGNSRGGAGGGAGGWASYLFDMTKAKEFSVLIGAGGSAGGVEGNGGDGGSSKITCGGTTVVTCSGGKGAVGSNYWAGCGAAGAGGSVTIGVTTNTTLGIKLLDFGSGAVGGKGASVSNSHGAGTQGGHGPSSISFGGLLNITNIGVYGGSSAKCAISSAYKGLDDRCAIGGGGGASMLASGGHGCGAMNTYNTVYTTAQTGTYGSGGGGGHGGYTGKGGALGGSGAIQIHVET